MKKPTLSISIVFLLNIVIHTSVAQSLQKMAIPSFNTTEKLQKAIEDFAMDNVPHGDLVDVLKRSPEFVKAGLTPWLNRKMVDAATAKDWGRHNRYMAFFVCHAKNNCQLLKELQAEAKNPAYRSHWMQSMGRCTCEDLDLDNHYDIIYNDRAEGKLVLVPDSGTLSACKQLAADTSNCKN